MRKIQSKLPMRPPWSGPKAMLKPKMTNWRVITPSMMKLCMIVPSTFLLRARPP